MFSEKREFLFANYQKGYDYFIQNPERLILLEQYTAQLICAVISKHYHEIRHDYNEASYLYPLWANYPPEDRGRSPIGDQVPWIEVGEQAAGHKLPRLLSEDFRIAEVAVPSGADNRFLLYSDEYSKKTQGLTGCVFIFLDIKSEGPRDDFPHAVLSPYQVSGDGIWRSPRENLINSVMKAQGKRVSHDFYPAIAPIYPFTDGSIAPTIHLFVRTVYGMSRGVEDRGQPLEHLDCICVPNGLLLTKDPGYLNRYPGLFFPGKDDKTKDPRKARVRVSFDILKKIAPWRVVQLKR